MPRATTGAASAASGRAVGKRLAGRQEARERPAAGILDQHRVAEQGGGPADDPGQPGTLRRQPHELAVDVGRAAQPRV